jgi:Fur family transcriptional regulator, ferric uptake regulator
MANTREFKLLDEFGLRQTNCRRDILSVFLIQNHALSHAHIEESLSGEFDRVTIYRTLKTFLEKGLIHKVLDDEGTPKYALCNTTCNGHTHNHEHVHFKCTSCGETNCMEDIEIPALSLPQGYKMKEANLLIQGVCGACNTSEV